MAECPRCDGTGRIEFSTAGEQDDTAWPDESEPCASCGGTGQVDTVEYRRDAEVDRLVDAYREGIWA